MLQLDDFVFGATIQLSFGISDLLSEIPLSSLSGKLQRNGETFLLTNSIIDTELIMSSATNTLPAGKYKFVLLWYNTTNNEPIEEYEYDLTIKPRK